MRINAYVVLMGIAGALFVLAALNIGIQNLDFVALGLAFVAAALVAERAMPATT